MIFYSQFFNYTEGVKHQSPGLWFSTLGIKSLKPKTLKGFNKRNAYRYQNIIESGWGSYSSDSLPKVLKSKHPGICSVTPSAYLVMISSLA